MMEIEDLIDLEVAEDHGEKQLEHTPDEGSEVVSNEEASAKSQRRKSCNSKKRPLNSDHSGLTREKYKEESFDNSLNNTREYVE